VRLRIMDSFTKFLNSVKNVLFIQYLVKPLRQDIEERLVGKTNATWAHRLVDRLLAVTDKEEDEPRH
jgi:hypothetical protein